MIVVDYIKLFLAWFINFNETSYIYENNILLSHYVPVIGLIVP